MSIRWSPRPPTPPNLRWAVRTAKKRTPLVEEFSFPVCFRWAARRPVASRDAAPHLRRSPSPLSSTNERLHGVAGSTALHCRRGKLAAPTNSASTPWPNTTTSVATHVKAMPTINRPGRGIHQQQERPATTYSTTATKGSRAAGITVGAMPDKDRLLARGTEEGKKGSFDV